MDAPDDVAALVGHARAGDATAFEKLVRRHFRAVYAVTLAVLRNVSDAEDVAQDSFIVAFERLDTCRQPERFAGWLVQIARNRALNALQSRRTATKAIERSAIGSATMTTPSELCMRDRLLSVLECITQAQREVVLLHDLEGWTHAEIGQTLGISEIMSRQHLFQARQELRALLNDTDLKEVDNGSQA